MSAIERLKSTLARVKPGYATVTDSADLRALLEYAEKSEAALAAETERANALAVKLAQATELLRAQCLCERDKEFKKMGHHDFCVLKGIE